MNFLLNLSRAIDTVNRSVGRTLSWLVLVAVLISAINAVVRKMFGVSSNSWLELQWVLFSVIFLVGASWTLLDNEHIRIDIINNMLPKRVRDTIDLVGHAFFLLPFTIVMLVTSLPFFLVSYRINEQSGNAGGLPQWPAKSLVFIGFAFLLTQALSELIKRIAIMRGLIADPHAAAAHSAAEAEAERVLSVMKSETE
ncbi:MAG TPA: TRAP transporter small permease subunit [Xanthobacteraceae bacterium]|nr:TRAP transporter small permease subunit [Xanthobacteraceae bacterium]